MKKLIIIPIIAVLIAGMVSAEPIKEQRNSKEKADQLRDNGIRSRNGRARENTSVSVEGTLKLEKGFIAVENADNVYLVPMLNRYIGFINGLREGSKVSVEGYEFNNMIRPTKLTVEGKSYDFMTWDRDQDSGFGRRDFYPDNNRRFSGPGWNNRGYGNRNGRNGSCCW